MKVADLAVARENLEIGFQPKQRVNIDTLSVPETSVLVIIIHHIYFISHTFDLNTPHSEAKVQGIEGNPLFSKSAF